LASLEGCFLHGAICLRTVKPLAIRFIAQNAGIYRAALHSHSRSTTQSATTYGG